MFIEIAREGEPKSAHFGVSDLVVEGASVRVFYFGGDESAEYDGIVSAAAAASTFNKESAREAIVEDAITKNIPVVVAESGHNPQIIEAARELENDDEFGGDIELMS